MSNRLLKTFIAIVLAFCMVFGLSGSASAQQPSDELWIVTLSDWAAAGKAKDWVASHNGRVRVEYNIVPAMAVSLNPRAAQEMGRVPWVKNVIPDQRVFKIDAPYEWGVERVNADDVHLTGNKGGGVNVAVLDTGIDYLHIDVRDCYYGGYDFGGWFFLFEETDADPMDYDGHGTHCAGIVAAEYNDFGVTGVAPEAHLYAVKVFDDMGYSLYSMVIAGLEWCMETHNDSNPDNDIQIISMSIGSAVDAGDPGIESWINEAYQDYGILIVAAAGNEYSGVDTVIYPARYPNVVAVAATAIDNTRASFSSTGPTVELSSPGVGIRSTYLNHGYETWSGTSMACPHVSGTAALVMKAHPDWTNVQVREQLQNTAVDLGTPGKDDFYGYGLVDAYAAATPTGNLPPTANAGPDQEVADSDGSGSEEVTLNGSASNDPDGTIVSYAWSEGGSPIGTGESLTRNFDVGTHTVTLTVTDDVGATDTDEVLVVVNANLPPIANAGPDQEVADSDGSGSEEGTLNGSASNDPDGTIASYTWSEGGSPIGTGESLTRNFDVGTHTVTLTVTDDVGATDTDEVLVVVTEAAVSKTIHVADIDMSIESRAAGRNIFASASAEVTIEDANGIPVEGMVVYGQWSELTGDSDSGITDTNGKVVLTSDRMKNSSGIFVFTVVNITKEGWTYDPEANLETSDSITLP
ncbi:S8 family serine peptidase [Chloroflexota bacterium]